MLDTGVLRTFGGPQLEPRPPPRHVPTPPPDVQGPRQPFPPRALAPRHAPGMPSKAAPLQLPPPSRLPGGLSSSPIPT
ncbi:vegetative cell wall protein gp1-like [Dromiciops gliroides]|uniref:vegetative cell wall protein gp1-like n=1 Tax=Dromiciops gliroides TaxID=33562 RepID=UPI001CC7705B|nr:vegetative cell wall protein gp1-like [Dromiciops gliroides]